MITRIQPQQNTAYSSFASAQKPVGLSGAAAKTKFGFNPGMIKAAEAFNGFISSSRARELLIIDLLGFTLLRTGMDLSREFLYRNTVNNKRQFNWAAARERFIMELSGGIVSDALTGLFGFGIGLVLDQAMQGMSNKFIDVDKMKLFTAIAKKSEVKNPQQFITQLSQELAGNKSAQILPFVKKSLFNGLDAEVASAEISKVLKQSHFDKVIRGTTYGIDGLLADAKLFADTITKRTTNASTWNQVAKNTLTQTNRINAFRIPIGLAAGIALNFSMPYLIQSLTRKFAGINDYPGEMGLRNMKHVDKFHDTKRGMLPYLKESLKKGNIVPTLISMMPLPIIFGMVDTDKLSFHGLKAAFNNPFKAGFLKRAMSMMQFGRKFPFAGGQQIAMLYALVVFSRVAAARTAVEFRERTVDAFLGWTIWVLANPWMKKKIAQWSDQKYGTQLIKKVGGLTSVRNESEIQKLLKNPIVRQKSLNQLTMITAFSTLSTILLLGIIEPYFSIRLTEWQAKRLNRKPNAITVE